MVLFVDETENNEFFIVTGLLVKSREAANDAFTHFKHSIKNQPISPKYKGRIFTEFKSFILDRDYKKIKIRMLEEVNNIEHCIIYSCFIKKGCLFSQDIKEKTYIFLLSKIISSIDEDICIVFDRFNKPEFERLIISHILIFPNVQAAMPRDSQLEEGLQLVDNICSVIRLKKSGTDIYDFYDIIKDYIIEV